MSTIGSISGPTEKMYDVRCMYVFQFFSKNIRERLVGHFDHDGPLDHDEIVTVSVHKFRL